MQDENLAIWLPRLAVHGEPRFLQIADVLQAAVVEGLLKQSNRLPPQRQGRKPGYKPSKYLA